MDPCLQDEKLDSFNRKSCKQRTYDLLAGTLADFLVLLEKEFPDLAVVMNKWNRMPEAIRRGILAMAQAADDTR